MDGCPHFAMFTPSSPEIIRDPYPAYAMAREQAPVFFEPELGVWCVTRHDDVLRILKETSVFSSAAAIATGEIPGDLIDRLPAGYPWEHPSLINQDPPGHTRVRKLCNQAFRPSVIAARESEVRQVANMLVDRFEPAGRAELIHRFAAPFPQIVIGRILGIPEEDLGEFSQWGDDMIALMSPTTSAEARHESATRAAEFYDYCGTLVEQRRREPRDDLTTELINATVHEGMPLLDDRELVSVLAQLIVGGHETSTYMIGSVVLRLLERPAVLEEVRDDPRLATAAVEESLRHTGPVRGLFRVAMEDATFGDVVIPAGDVMQVHFASASHDPAHFGRPDEFDIHRSDVNGHLGLGKGTHFCLGAPLVRLEGTVALQVLLARLPSLRLEDGGRVTFAPTPIHHGLRELDVVWDA